MSEQTPATNQRHELPPEDVQALGSLTVVHTVEAPLITFVRPEYVVDPEGTANYQGNWTLAQAERMTHPYFQNDYQGFINRTTESLKEGEPRPLDKETSFKSYWSAQVEGFEERGDAAYEAMNYAPAAASGNKPSEVGRSGIGKRPTIFTDAETRDGTPLDDRQKDIIAAHEAYHTMITVPEPAKQEVLKGFDTELYYSEIVPSENIKRVGYMVNPDELMPRMAQLKNYFGMKSFNVFTKEHLDYARSHYVEDTGLDNSMSTMFRMVSPRTEAEFLRLMNTLPV